MLAFEEDFMADPVADPWESEAGELFRNFQKTEPQRKRLSVEETNYITRFVRDNPDLTISKATGIERFQAKQCLLPDGRLLIVKESQTRQDHTSIYHGVLFTALF